MSRHALTQTHSATLASVAALIHCWYGDHVSDRPQAFSDEASFRMTRPVVALTDSWKTTTSRRKRNDFSENDFSDFHNHKLHKPFEAAERKKQHRHHRMPALLCKLLWLFFPSFFLRSPSHVHTRTHKQSQQTKHKSKNLIHPQSTKHTHSPASRTKVKS